MNKLRLLLILFSGLPLSCILITENKYDRIEPYVYCKIDGIETVGILSNYYPVKYRPFEKKILFNIKSEMLSAGQGMIKEDSILVEWNTLGNWSRYHSLGIPGDWYITRIDSITQDISGHFEFWAHDSTDTIHITDGAFLISANR